MIVYIIESLHPVVKCDYVFGLQPFGMFVMHERFFSVVGSQISACESPVPLQKCKHVTWVS